MNQAQFLESLGQVDVVAKRLRHLTEQTDDLEARLRLGYFAVDDGTFFFFMRRAREELRYAVKTLDAHVRLPHLATSAE
jgi:hypothetical protein